MKIRNLLLSMMLATGLIAAHADSKTAKQQNSKTAKQHS